MLNIHTNKNLAGNIQAYAAGYLEGYLTNKQIGQVVQPGVFSHCEFLVDVLQLQGSSVSRPVTAWDQWAHPSPRGGGGRPLHKSLPHRGFVGGGQAYVSICKTRKSLFVYY